MEGAGTGGEMGGRRARVRRAGSREGGEEGGSRGRSRSAPPTPVSSSSPHLEGRTPPAPPQTEAPPTEPRVTGRRPHDVQRNRALSLPPAEKFRAGRNAGYRRGWPRSWAPIHKHSERGLPSEHAKRAPPKTSSAPLPCKPPPRAGSRLLRGWEGWGRGWRRDEAI